MGAGHAPKGAFFFSVWKKMVGIRILQVLNQKQIFFKTLYFLWTTDTFFGEVGNKSRLAEMFFPASASCKLTSSGPQLFSMWLCYFHSFMGYGDGNDSQQTLGLCLTRGIGSLVLQFLSPCLLPHFQQVTGLCSRCLQTAGHLVLEDLQNWGISALMTFIVKLRYYLFRGCEIGHNCIL